MNWRSLTRLGLGLLLLGLLGPVVLEATKLAEKDDLGSLTGWILRGAGLVLGVALLLWILEKLGLRVAGARCGDCKKRIPYGHAYCYDHLRDRTHKAQEKYHGQRGMGI